MDATAPVQNLLTNGEALPLAVEGRPLLSWAADPRQRLIEIEVADESGACIWRSERIASRLPEARADCPLASRSAYTWRVRVSSDGSTWSDWSERARWETGQLKDDDWEADWISLPVAAANRNLVTKGRISVEWTTQDCLSQMFTSPGPFVAVHADLTGENMVDVAFDLEVVDSAGRVVATRTVDGPQHLWDRFMHFVALPHPAPAGTYELKLRPLRGKVGWFLADERFDQEDDGITPLALVGPALTNGERRPGVRAAAVETVPAPNPVFKASFRVDGRVASARLSAVALGNGIVTINGAVVGDAILDPAPTDYSARVLYRRWDVTDHLHSGDNEIEIHAGRGTFAARGANVWGWNLAPWHQEPIARARLDWSLHSGQHGVLTTSGGWQAKAGSTVSELLFGGETSTSEENVHGSWVEATATSGPTGVVCAARLPPMREIEILRPVSETALGKGRTLYDFGTLITGWPRMSIRGSAGSAVRIASGEALSPDGRVETHNFLVAGPSQVDVHRFEVEDEIAGWGPRFGYRGFRWVEVSTQGDASVSEITGVLAHTDIAPASDFDTDEPVLTWADAAFRRTFLNNMQGIPTDTPIYEKNGWTADAMLATEAIMHHVDVRATFGKWMQDHADSQGSDGVVPQIVPSPGFGRAADPGWSGSTVIIPWQLYWEYGDLDQLAASAPTIERYCDALLSISRGRLWPIRSWGDWLAPGFELAPEGAAPAATMMMTSVLQHAARIMSVIGQPHVARDLSVAAEESARAYHVAYFDEKAGTYRVPGVSYRQSMSILPLAFGTVPPELRPSVASSLIEDIEGRTKGHLDAGAIGARHLLHVLSDLGRDDLALTVATQRTRPGWGIWFEDGETTLMESWDADARSRNHYFLGAALSWVHQRVGGLRAAAPGWEHIEIRPIDDPRITRGMLTHRTVRGEAALSWRRLEDRYDLDVTIPPGATGLVQLPSGPVDLVEGHHRLQVASGSVSEANSLSFRPLA
ncbi:family 78 glycoside hydrolase catalytic domain [Nocardioides sp. WG-D5]